ncbi:MAG TPA: carboxypeptidase regulatory-like domain-containing protein [Bryobacteraceae bacterium]|nr:carboxypeptidase regulatory-like domain-containing protein [Bryobacteraceae bacterium]
MNQVCSARAVVLALIVLLCAGMVWAQTDLGSISGFVKDPSGAVIPKAKVTVRNESGLERQATTNDSGYYTVTNIPPAFYTVSVEVAGFKKFESTANKLDASAALSVDVTMTVGSNVETVEVSATATVLQTESASVQKDVTREQIDSLELNGRNPIFMANLVPGTRGGNLAGLSFNFSQGPSNINGARTPESLITYDGAPAVRTRSNGTSLGAADVDSTQEIQILTASYAPEFGRSSGGQIRILTKSGGQSFHGAAYDYIRNDVFNANTWSRNHTLGQQFTAPINYNQFGYNVGGPIYIPNKFNTSKNKFFFYFGQEWVRYRFTDISNLTVPSLLMRQGNFSELLSPTNVFYGKTVTVKDPTTGNPFPGNIIPTAQLSPNGIGILKAYPVPNLGGFINGNNNWSLALNHPQHQRKDTYSVDMNLTDRQRLQFRRMNYAFWEYQPLDGGTNETPKYFNRPNQTNSLNHIWTIAPTLVNEALATVSLDDVYIPVDQAHFLDRTTVGINYPYIFPQGKLIPTRIPTVNLSSFSQLSGGPYPSHSAGPIYDFSDTLTWVKGSHTLKFGALYERSGENDNDEINVSGCSSCTNNQNGQFAFSDTRLNNGLPTTGVGVANAALGLFDTYSELGQRGYTVFRGSMIEAFAGDSWKASQKLHLDYGVRYTVIVPYSALWRNMAVFAPEFYDPSKAVTVDPKTGTIIPNSGDRYNGLVIPGTGFPSYAVGRFPEASDSSLKYLFRGANPHYSDIQYNDIQPRLGVAYAVNDKTVIRAGGGRFYTRLGVSDSIFLGGNPPFQPTANVTGGSADNPGGTSANLLPLTATTQSKAFKNPEAFSYNVTVEREFYGNTLLSVGYVGRRGVHLQRESDINQPTIAAVVANPGANLDSLRPYKGYSTIRETDNVGTSKYNSLQVSANRRFTKGLGFGLAYTYSKSTDSGSAQRDVIPNTYDAHNLWGLSDFDVTHIFILSYIYELPFFKNQHNFAGKALGGWQVSGITQFQTGTPFCVTTSNDYAGVGQDGNLQGTGCSGQFWILNGSPSITHQIALNGSVDAKYWFQTTDSSGNLLFSAPTKNTFNTQPAGFRNFLHNPGFENWNVGLFKRFAITERTGFQFRAEAFDVFNHANWSGVNTNPTNLSTFGKITSKTGDVRNLQLSLRFYF